MNKQKKSGAAIFMYCVIAISLALSAICFTLYYTKTKQSSMILWVGIVSFMIMYHLWMRIIMGNVTKLFKIHHSQRWFKERAFEKSLYSFLCVKKWKDRALTYNPELFSLKSYSLEDVANTMAKAEADHWVNEIISLSAILFSLIWGKVWIFALTSFAAMIFDAQFIVIQRYNRPRILKILNMQKIRKEKKVTHEKSF